MFLKLLTLIILLILGGYKPYAQIQIGQDISVNFGPTIRLEYLKLMPSGKEFYFGRDGYEIKLYRLNQNIWQEVYEEKLSQTFSGRSDNNYESFIFLGKENNNTDRGLKSFHIGASGFSPLEKIYTEYSQIQVYGSYLYSSAFYRPRILIYSSANQNSTIFKQFEFFDLTNNTFEKSLNTLKLDMLINIYSAGFFDNDLGIILNCTTPFFGEITHRHILYSYNNGSWNLLKDTGIFKFPDNEYNYYLPNFIHYNRYYVDSKNARVCNILAKVTRQGNLAFLHTPKLVWYYFNEATVSPRLQEIDRTKPVSYSFNSNGSCVAVGGNDEITEDNRVNFFYFDTESDMYKKSAIEILPDHENQLIGEYLNLSENGKFVLVSFRDTTTNNTILRVYDIDIKTSTKEVFSEDPFERILKYQPREQGLTIKSGWHLTGIYDISGRMVMAHVHDRTVPTEHMSPGIYIAVLSDGQELRSEKFVKF